jgi:hypothetical protein
MNGGQQSQRMSAVGSCLLLAALLLAAVGCERREGRPAQPRYDAVAAGRAAIAQYDTDGDGKIAGAELDRSPALKAAADQIDSSGRREITGEMIATRIEAWERSKIAGMRIRCVITRKGKRIEGADVTFVPEKFLGDKGMIAKGKTDGNGVATMSHPKLDALGRKPAVVVGFYRVEVTKRGEQIPARYNTDTILGQEVAKDAEGLSGNANQTIEFDLDY